MIMSRSVAAAETGAAASKSAKKKAKLPTLDEFVDSRDYSGAVALLEFERSSGRPSAKNDEWIAYCLFHLGNYKKSLEEYRKLCSKDDCPPAMWSNVACCCFFLGLYKEAEEAALKAPPSCLQNRQLFHLAQKFGDDKKLMEKHKELKDVVEDQLSLASIHYLRGHYQEAIDIYKRILLDKREYWALHVYIALCYYKLDYYDVSQQVLGSYLQRCPDSVTANNLKACNHCRLYNGKAAEAELRSLNEMASVSFVYAEELIRHNMVVFRQGDRALQVLPPLVGIIPEARLNLVIYYLKQDDYVEAYNLIKDVEPQTPQEYILKGIANAIKGQEEGSKDHVRIAQQFFQLVGGSASECDTIHGRQCMASCFFLLKQFSDVGVYLNSIKSYFYNDDSFNFTFGQTKAALGAYKEAQEALLAVQSDKLKSDYCYISWLTRCYIMNHTPNLAWELYSKMETSGESVSLLQVIANDCYKMGQFYYAAKAFDILERLEGPQEWWEGKRGACIGVFQMIIANKEPRETLKEVLDMLHSSPSQQVDYITRIMKRWAKANVVPLEMP